MIIVILVLLMIVFLTASLGHSKFYAHGGGYATPIAVFNMLMALVCLCLIIYRLSGGNV